MLPSSISDVHTLIKELEPELCGKVLEELSPKIHIEPVGERLKNIMKEDLSEDVKSMPNWPYLPSSDPKLFTEVSKSVDASINQNILNQVFEHSMPGDLLEVLLRFKLAPGMDF